MSECESAALQLKSEAAGSSTFSGCTWVRLLALPILLGAPLEADEIRVPDEAPTIQSAIGRARDGDVILIDEGVYRENITLAGKLVSLKGTGCPQRTVVDGMERGSTVRIEHPGAFLEGLTITGGLAGRGGGISIATSFTGPPVEVELQRLILRDNRAADGGGGIAALSAPGSPVRLYMANLLVDRNSARSGGGILLQSDPMGGAVEALAVNCTIAHNEAEMDGAGLATLGPVFPFGGPEVPLTFNSIFWENRLPTGELQDLFLLPPGSVRFSNISDGQFAGEEGNISDDPLFRDPDTGDYRLSEGSPCIDAGVSGVGPVGAPDRDFEGAVRFDNPDLPNSGGDIQEMGIDEDSPSFVRGDSDGNGKVELTDAIYTFDHLFITEKPTPCVAAMDSNDDEGVDISDGIYTLAYLFLGGPVIPLPFPLMGLDPTFLVAGLECEQYPNCWVGAL